MKLGAVGCQPFCKDIWPASEVLAALDVKPRRHLNLFSPHKDTYVCSMTSLSSRIRRTSAVSLRVSALKSSLSVLTTMVGSTITIFANTPSAIAVKRHLIAL